VICEGCKAEKPDVETAPFRAYFVIRDDNEKIISIAEIGKATPALCSDCVNGSEVRMRWIEPDEESR
jgi:hypothetical protein